MLSSSYLLLSFFFNDTASPEIYTLSLHDALPIFHGRLGKLATQRIGGFLPASRQVTNSPGRQFLLTRLKTTGRTRDRKSTRLNSSHSQISYAVFCLKKKMQILQQPTTCTRITCAF